MEAGAGTPVALPVAPVLVDSGQAHLDRPFDYAVPAELDEVAQPGVRVRVRFAGRLVGGFLLGRTATSSSGRALAPLHAVVSPERVLTPAVAALARAAADRWGAPVADVLRLAVPPRHARAEASAPAEPAPVPAAPAPGGWERYPGGPALLAALARQAAPRAVWTALPGGGWPEELAAALLATAASGRGALLVVPDARDVARVVAALGDEPHAVLTAQAGPQARYRTWLRVLRGEVRVVVGTRAAAWAPVADLGLVAVWDDGDDLHDEPRSPYCTTRDVLALRAHLEGAAFLCGSTGRTTEAALLVRSGWAHSLVADRAVVRQAAPRVAGVSEADVARDPRARAARLPATAFGAARSALEAGAPVLVQVPRRGYAPALACARDRTPATCPVCSGPLATAARDRPPACRWCGRPAADWRCPGCAGTALRALVVGASRTAEELGRAFPGAVVRTSGRDEVLDRVPAEPALVISTPGAEPVADGGYGAVLLLDAWALLGRADLRATEEALRRWLLAASLCRPAAEGGTVVVAADAALPAVQALVRWDPVAFAERELDERAALRLPPAVRMAAVDGAPTAVRALVDAAELPAAAEVLGPVPTGEGERLLVRVPRQEGRALAVALRAARAVRSAAKAEPVRLELDPRSPA